MNMVERTFLGIHLFLLVVHLVTFHVRVWKANHPLRIEQDTDIEYQQVYNKEKRMDAEERSFCHVRPQDYSSQTIQIPREDELRNYSTVFEQMSVKHDEWFADEPSFRSTLLQPRPSLHFTKGHGTSADAHKPSMLNNQEQSKPTNLQMKGYEISVQNKRKAASYYYLQYPYSNLWRAGAEKRRIQYSTDIEAFSNIQDYREPSDSNKGSEIYKKYSEMQNAYGYFGSTLEKEMQPEKTPIQYRSGNPWGSLSYADLITAAILSAKEKKMTLEEIYQWIISNVSYFGDKGDDNSRVNWKNSIRCNLSTRKRFLRIPRTSLTGVKSYRGWWTVNESMLSDKLRRKLLVFRQENHSIQAASRDIATSSDFATNYFPQTTSRETQTEMSRFCKNCHYFLVHLTPCGQTVPSV